MRSFQPVPPTGPVIGLSGRPLGSQPLFRPARYLSDFVISAGMVVIFVLSMAVVGRLGETFRDFHLKLPGVTRAILDLNAIYMQFAGWALVWVIPFVAPLVLGQADRRWRRFLFLGGYLLVAAFIVVIVLAMMIPLTTLIEGISYSGGKS